jgi:hypothetical protein
MRPEELENSDHFFMDNAFAETELITMRHEKEDILTGRILDIFFEHCGAEYRV